MNYYYRYFIKKKSYTCILNIFLFLYAEFFKAVPTHCSYVFCEENLINTDVEVIECVILKK